MEHFEASLSKQESVVYRRVKESPASVMDIEEKLDHTRDWSKKYVTGLVSRINQKAQDLTEKGENIIVPKQINGILHYKFAERAISYERTKKTQQKEQEGFWDNEALITRLIIIVVLLIILLLLKRVGSH